MKSLAVASEFEHVAEHGDPPAGHGGLHEGFKGGMHRAGVGVVAIGYDGDPADMLHLETHLGQTEAGERVGRSTEVEIEGEDVTISFEDAADPKAAAEALQKRGAVSIMQVPLKFTVIPAPDGKLIFMRGRLSPSGSGGTLAYSDMEQVEVQRVISESTTLFTEADLLPHAAAGWINFVLIGASGTIIYLIVGFLWEFSTFPAFHMMDWVHSNRNGIPRCASDNREREPHQSVAAQ